MKRMVLVFVSVLLLTDVVFGQTARPLTNDDVVQMLKAGLDDTTVIKAIKVNESAFDSSGTSLVALKSAGVSKPVLDAMLETQILKKNATQRTTTTASKDPNPGLPELLLSVVAFGQVGRPLTNDDIVQMLRAGLDENTVIKAIQANESAFDTSVNALVALTAAGVPKPVIDAMLEAQAAKKNAGSSGTTTATAKEPVIQLPDEVGVYINQKGKLTEVEPEIVSWRAESMLKKTLSLGGTKGRINGTVKNNESKLRVGRPLEVIIRCPEGTLATEYQILQLDQRGDQREFHTIAGAAIHESGVAEKNALNIQPEKLATRVYRIRLADLKRGEYGILPPGAASATAASGKIYTFSVSD